MVELSDFSEFSVLAFFVIFNEFLRLSESSKLVLVDRFVREKLVDFRGMAVLEAG